MLLAIFSFLALALAPLATPTAAVAATKPCSTGMISEHGSHGQMPSDHAATDHADHCCIGVASALLASSTEISEPLVTESLVTASHITKLSGIQPAAADPPPRA